MGLDAPLRDVYNPINDFDLRSLAFACHARVTAGVLEEEEQLVTFETQPAEAGALSRAKACGRHYPSLSIFRYRDAGGGLLRGRA